MNVGVDLGDVLSQALSNEGGHMYRLISLWPTHAMNTPHVTDVYKRHGFPQRSSATVCGCTIASSSAIAMARSSWQNAVAPCPTKPCGIWCRTWGRQYANQRRCRRPRPGDTWHLDEGFLTINKERHSLWRVRGEQDGNVLDILIRRWDKHGAEPVYRKLLQRYQDVPRVIITDKLKSYGAAKRGMLPGVEHRKHWYRNNRAEELLPAHPTVGAAHARLYVLWPCATVARYVWADGPALPSPT